MFYAYYIWDYITCSLFEYDKDIKSAKVLKGSATGRNLKEIFFLRN